MRLDIQNLRLDPALSPLASVLYTRPAIIHAVGANVSWFFQAIMGLTTPSQGSITWNNTVLYKDHQIYQSIWQRSRLGIRYLPSPKQLFRGLSVEQSLKLALPPKIGSNLTALREIYAQLPILAVNRQRQVWQLSGGQQQILAIACCLIGHAPLLLLEDPLAGLSIPLQQQVWQLLFSHVQKKQALVIFSSTQPLYPPSSSDPAAISFQPWSLTDSLQGA